MPDNTHVTRRARSRAERASPLPGGERDRVRGRDVSRQGAPPHPVGCADSASPRRGEGSASRPPERVAPAKRGRAKAHLDGQPIDRRPFFAREANRTTWDDAIKLADFIGFHLICPRLRCRRAAACAAQDKRDWPFCTKHYRPIMRYVMEWAAAARGEKPPGEQPREPLNPAGGEADGPEPARPSRPRGTSLLGLMAAQGAPIHELARSAEAGRDPWEWHRDQEALAYLAELRARAGKRGEADSTRSQEEPEGRR